MTRALNRPLPIAVASSRRLPTSETRLAPGIYRLLYFAPWGRVPGLAKGGNSPPVGCLEALLKLGLCVIGCGGFARTFAEQVGVARDRIDLFFASRDYARAKDYCDEFNGAGAFGSYEDAASDPRVDALYVCTPHHLHLEHAQLAARAKKHILLEKPIARTIDEAQAIISAANAARRETDDRRELPVPRPGAGSKEDHRFGRPGPGPPHPGAARAPIRPHIVAQR